MLILLTYYSEKERIKLRELIVQQPLMQNTCLHTVLQTGKMNLSRLCISIIFYFLFYLLLLLFLFFYALNPIRLTNNFE